MTATLHNNLQSTTSPQISSSAKDLTPSIAKNHERKIMTRIMTGSLLCSLGSLVRVNKESNIGLHLKTKISCIGHIKVTEASIVASSKQKYVKRREGKKLNISDSRKSNVTVNGKDKKAASVQNSSNLDHEQKLQMVNENGASYADVTDKGSLHTTGRDAVLKACVVTSGIFAGMAVTIREVSHITSEAGLPFPDCTKAMPYNFEWSQAEMLAALVVLISSCRQLLLLFWPEFAESSKTANRQILGSLDIWDYAVVSFLPGISEELLFRGVLLPLVGLDWKGVLAAGITFGTLHLGGGRKTAFSLWASFVGVVYGFAAVSSSSLLVPIAAHSLNNLIGGLLWKYFDQKEHRNTVDT